MPSVLYISFRRLFFIRSTASSFVSFINFFVTFSFSVFLNFNLIKTYAADQNYKLAANTCFYYLFKIQMRKLYIN